MDVSTTAEGWGDGTVTNPRNFTWDWLDLYMTPHPVREIDVDGRHVYYVNYNPSGLADRDLQAVSLREPSNLVLDSTRNSWGDLISIAVEGHLLLTGRAGSAPRISSYNNTSPYELGISATYRDYEGATGSVTDIDIEGPFAYYTSYGSTIDSSLNIVDVMNLNNIIDTPCDWSSSKTLGLEVEGHFAYLAESDMGMYILNVSNKNHVIEYGHVDTPGNATDVIIDGYYAYLADGPGGVHVIDIRDPSNPEIIGSYDTNGNARRLVKQGNTLFVADGSGGVKVLDVRDPENPILATEQYPLPFGDAWDVDIYGGILVVGADLGIYTYEIAAFGGGITDFSKSAYPNAFDDLQCWDVRVDGNITYCAGGPDGFYTLDVSDPSNPTLLDHIPIAGNARKLDIKGSFAHVISYNGYYIFDIRDPSDIKQVHYNWLNQCIDVFVHGEVVYISWGQGGVAIENVSQPTNFNFLPDQFSEPHFGTNVTALWVQGPHLYTVEWHSSADPCFHVHDIRDLTNTRIILSKNRVPTIWDIKVDGGLAYLGAGRWMSEYNVSDPFAFTYPDWIIHDSMGVWNFGPYVLSAALTDGVSIINATNTINIVEESNYADATGAIQITTHGDFTYVANKSSLVILRHFESAADTYVAGTTFAQSLSVDSVSRIIYSATLNAEDFTPEGSDIDYFMSADGGTNWDVVTPGVEHIFANPGSDLRWRAEITGASDRSPHLYELTIDYFYNDPPTDPHINDPGDVSEVSNVEVTWNASTDDTGIDHYELQVDREIGFGTPINSYNVTDLSHVVSGLTNGTYYFRVRAVDNYDLASDWSDVVDIKVEIPATNIPWWAYVIVGGGLVLIIVIIVVVVMVRKRKAIPAR